MTKKLQPSFVRDLLRWAVSPRLRPNLAADTYALYECDALHERHTHMRSSFTGTVPFVRVSLAPRDTPDIETPVGEVLHSDHLVYSMLGVSQRFPELAGDLHRLELITTAREGGTRFAPISIFLGYGADDRSPDFVVLETGLVNGEPRRLFGGSFKEAGSELVADIEAPVGYKPTPFSSETHVYRSRVVLRDGDLARISVNAHRTDDEGAAHDTAYVTVTLSFSRVPWPQGSPHWFHYQAAQLRVATVAEGLGIDLEPRYRLLAQVGKLLPWIRRP